MIVVGTTAVYLDEESQMIFVMVCPACGQAVSDGSRCNSGAHQGLGDGNAGIEPVRSIDLVRT